LGVERGANDQTPKQFTVTKAWRRPRSTQGFSASKEEEKEDYTNRKYLSSSYSSWIRTYVVCSALLKSMLIPPS
jgi:hypothetical protein